MNIDLKALTCLLPAGSRVLCAVSGGADSMCLLHLLWHNRRALGIEIFAAHFEHGIRGEESQRDAAFVASWCRERGILCRIGHGDVPAWAKAHGLGWEEAARKLRYAFLEQTARELNCGRIATAHNADDNAETVLFNLTRGGGAAGLRGIPPVRGPVVRPLLGITRKEIEDYLRENDVAHVEDSSNASDDYSRNRIRHQVIPVLREINPAFSAAVLRTAELLRQDEDCLSQMAETFIQAHFDGASLPVQELKKLHGSVASRVVRRLWEKELSLEHVKAVLSLADSTELAYADVPGGRISCERGRLYVKTPPAGPQIPDRVLIPGRCLEMPELGLFIRAEETVFDGEINDLFKTYCFKYESIYGNISCSGRKPGDKLRPKGRGCTKSLKSLFAEAGWSRRERDSALIFRDEAGVLAVHGLAVEERTVPTVGERAVRINIEKTGGEKRE